MSRIPALCALVSLFVATLSVVGSVRADQPAPAPDQAPPDADPAQSAPAAPWVPVLTPEVVPSGPAPPITPAPVYAPAPPPRPETAPPPPSSYSGQIVLADLAGILASVFVAGSQELSQFTVVPYLAASPLVHALHDHWGRAGASLGLHVITPLAGAVIGLEIDKQDCHDEFLCGIGGLVVGGLVGMIAATTIDAAYLARESPNPAPPAPAYASLSPVFAVARSGSATFGLAGRF